MTKDASEAFGEALTQAIGSLPDSDAFKKANDRFLNTISDELQFTVIQNMSATVEDFVRQMATSAVDAMLRGQDEQVRRYLGLNGWTGRDYEHDVIRGTIFETGSIQLRRMVVEANADLIRDERMADLEAQVAALTKRVAERDQRIETLQRNPAF